MLRFVDPVVVVGDGPQLSVFMPLFIDDAVVYVLLFASLNVHDLQLSGISVKLLLDFLLLL